MREYAESLFAIAFLAIEFYTYLLTMNFLFQIPFRREKNRWAICVALLVITHLVATKFGGIEFSDWLLNLTMGISALVLLQERKQKIIALYVFIHLAYSSFCAMMITLLAGTIHISERDLLEKNGVVFLIDCISPLIFSVMKLKRAKKKDSAEFTLQIQQIVFMLIGAAGIYVVMGTVQMMGNHQGAEVVPFFVRMVITAVCFLFLLLILWQGVVVNRHNQMAESMRLNELFDQMREEHFKDMHTQNEAMRRFRHDYRAHMLALKGYAERGEQAELSAYLDRLMAAGNVNTVRTYVGDAGVDAVINHLTERANQEGIQIQIDGSCQRPESVSSYELCSVFFNILTNAIEACLRVKEEEQKWILLQMRDYNQSVYIRLQNAAPQENTKATTWKSDKQNHGLGLGNVSRIIEKHEGRMNSAMENGTYSTEIVL